MLLAVSIPPSVYRTADSGSDCVTDIRDLAIRSWRASGFSIFSLNTPEELRADRSLGEFLERQDVFSLQVSPSAQGQPKFLPNLKDAISGLLGESSEEVIALTNSDIHLALSEKDIQQIESLDNGSFIVSHRTDVVSTASLFPNGNSGDGSRVYKYGLDLVIAHRSLLSDALAFTSPCLTLGLPWWDILLPIALLAVGGKLHHLDPVLVKHVKHDARAWNASWWNEIGREATAYLY